jgi:Ca2+:H+ antiporter
MSFFQRRPKADTIQQTPESEKTGADPEKITPSKSQEEVLPTHQAKHVARRFPLGIHPNGESGRVGVHFWHFARISFRSSSPVSCAVNFLWPVVPAAIVVTYARRDQSLVGFILNYIAMVPCANLIGFAGQELARKLPRVVGILWETTLGSVVEIVLFMVLLRGDKFPVIQAAILGSILATMLLCLGLCFFVGGMTRNEQSFSETVSEVGNGLLLTA